MALKKKTKSTKVARVQVLNPLQELDISPTDYEPTNPQKHFANLLCAGWTKEDARKSLKISMDTLIKWNFDPHYRIWLEAILRAAMGKQIGNVRRALYESAMAGDVQAMKEYLNAFDPEFKKSESSGPPNVYMALIQGIAGAAPEEQKPVPYTEVSQDENPDLPAPALADSGVRQR